MKTLESLLPTDLLERCLDPGATPREGGQYVLLWIRAAMRAESNPALAAAAALARGLGLPLLCYQALDDRHPHGSDRLWRFVLEGARDLSRDLGERGFRYAFHLVRPGHRAPALRVLGEGAAAVVADAHPVEPVRTWTEALRRGLGDVPLVEVDASCVVPLTASRRAYDRAFAFRNATKKARKRWLGWEAETGDAPAPFAGDLPFEPVDLEGDLDALIAACDVDHGIPPVPHTRGGTAAGRARWNAFAERRLGRYARDRNDALRPGVSRMSPYFHFGMVSPMAVAAEATRIGGAGAEKYLDELLVWRELAWHFCHHTPDIDSLSALPDWARETLREHADDPRPALYSPGQLAAGATDDELWNAMQVSLLRHGELHNNLRMTWGKAVLRWTSGPEEALASLLDLNHRYALDGRDPSSYGGILWCLGQFDRPFPPASPILGEVRGRSTKGHAARLDVSVYSGRVNRTAGDERMRIAVVGAGMSGLAAAGALLDAGHEVVAFDKARGVGGRTSLRRGAGTHFDHGAQYFTARDPRFRRAVDSWIEEGVVAPFRGALAVVDELGRPRGRGDDDTDRFVGTPGMNAMAKRMAEGVDVRVRSRVSALDRRPDGWALAFEDGDDATGFDRVLITAPAAQAAELLGDHSAELAALAADVEMTPCWAAMAAFEGPLATDFDGAFVNAGPLSWVCRNSTKAGRPEGETWVMHASADWTAEHLEMGREDVATALLAALAEALGLDGLPGTIEVDTHRWMYSGARTPLERGAAFDPEAGIALAGDWLAGAKVQGAWLSGRAAAGHLLREAAARAGTPPSPFGS